MDRPDSAHLPDLDVQALDPGRPAAQQIHDALKSAILSTDILPGCLISEAEIGARFGASRTPVREAFALLRDDGLIVTRPSRGNFVSKLSEHGIRQAQFMREGLELANVARLCATGVPPGIQTALEKSLAAQAEALAADDNQRFQRQDDRFHTLLARATGFSRAEAVLIREKAALDRLRVFALSSTAHRAKLLQEHRDILAAILCADSARAVAVTRAHLRSILGALSQLVQQNGDYFE